MVRSPFAVVTKAAVVPGDPFGREFDEVLWSYWQAASGRTKGFAPNWQKRSAIIWFVDRDGRNAERTLVLRVSLPISSASSLERGNLR